MQVVNRWVHHSLMLHPTPNYPVCPLLITDFHNYLAAALRFVHRSNCLSFALWKYLATVLSNFMGVRRWGSWPLLDFEIFYLAINVLVNFFSFGVGVGKMKFHQCYPSYKNPLDTWKNPSNAYA